MIAQAARDLGDCSQSSAVVARLIAVRHAGAIVPLVPNPRRFALKTAFEESIPELLGELSVGWLLLRTNTDRSDQCQQGHNGE